MVSRRSFLLAGAGLALGAACGRGGGQQAATTTSTAAQPLNLLFASFQSLAGEDRRLAFGVIRGQRPIAATEEVRIAVGPAVGPLGAAVEATRRAEGIEERPLHVLRADLPAPGRYRAVATVGGERSGEAVFEVIDPAASKVPVPGAPMVSVPTPTTADPRGVDPICTRVPACPWHEVSLDVALTENRPVVLLFSTPALCQSAVCGPVLDILLEAGRPLEDRVRFIHAEIFTDKTGKTTTPALQAYRLENEPFLFLAGPDGKVRERFDGPFDRAEAGAALARLTA